MRKGVLFFNFCGKKFDFRRYVAKLQRNGNAVFVALRLQRHLRKQLFGVDLRQIVSRQGADKLQNALNGGACLEILIGYKHLSRRVRKVHAFAQFNVGGNVFCVLNVQRQCQLRRGNGVVKTCCGNLGVQFFSLKITVKHGKYHVQCSRLFALVPACLHVEKAFEKFLFRQISVVAEVVKCFRQTFLAGNTSQHGDVVFAIRGYGVYTEVFVHCYHKFRFGKGGKSRKTGVVAHFVQDKVGRNGAVQHIAEGVHVPFLFFQRRTDNGFVVEDVSRQSVVAVAYFFRPCLFRVLVGSVFPLHFVKRRHFHCASGKVVVFPYVQLFAKFYKRTVTCGLFENVVSHNGAFGCNSLRNAHRRACSHGGAGKSAATLQFSCRNKQTFLCRKRFRRCSLRFFQKGAYRISLRRRRRLCALFVVQSKHNSRGNHY